jgi:hypothetical protein
MEIQKVALALLNVPTILMVIHYLNNAIMIIQLQVYQLVLYNTLQISQLNYV